MEDKFIKAIINENPYIEDFRTNGHNWAVNNSVNGSLNNVKIDGFIGAQQVRVDTDAGQNDYSNFQRNNAGNEKIKLGLGNYCLEFRTHIDNVPDVTNDFIIRMGLMNVSNQYAGITDGLLFKIEDSDGGKFKAISIKGGVSTITDTGIIALNNVLYKFKIMVNEDGSKVEFFIAHDGEFDYILVATHDTNIPNVYIGILFGIEAVSQISSARDIDIDYVKEQYILVNGR